MNKEDVIAAQSLRYFPPGRFSFEEVRWLVECVFAAMRDIESEAGNDETPDSEVAPDNVTSIGFGNGS